jgi:hypothetical protein
MHESHRRSLPGSWLAASAALLACSSGRTDQGQSVYVAPEAVGSESSGAGVTTGGETGGSGASAGSGDRVDSEAPGPSNSEPAGAIGSETTPSDLDIAGAGGTSTSQGAAASEGMSATAGVGGSGGSSAAGGSSGAIPEEDRVVLFDGTNLDAWISRNTGGPVGWQVVGDGSMAVSPGTGDIITRQEFEDVFVHAEYKTPMLPADVTGQDRGNSGIYLKGMYEVQVLDSFGRQPEIDGCGSIYGVHAPLTVACYQEEIWNTYEIEFQAPRYDDQGNKLSNARMLLVTLNGVVVQENTDVPLATRAGYGESPGPAGIMLQDHGNRLWFRNIWVIPR